MLRNRLYFRQVWEGTVRASKIITATELLFALFASASRKLAPCPNIFHRFAKAPRVTRTPLICIHRSVHAPRSQYTHTDDEVPIIPRTAPEAVTKFVAGSPEPIFEAPVLFVPHLKTNAGPQKRPSIAGDANLLLVDKLFHVG